MKGVEWAIAISDHPQATAEDAKRIVAEQLSNNPPLPEPPKQLED